MTKLNTTLFLTAHLLAFLASQASATPSSVTLGAEDSWPPYSDKQGEGISTNIIKAAFAKAGIQTQVKVRPYARVLQDVKSGLLDGGYNVTKQTNTEKDFVFGNVPILKAKAYWYFSPQHLLDIKDIHSIPNGFRVGGIIDYEYGDEYENQRSRFLEVRVPRQTQLIKMLQSGRVDAVIMFEEEANQVLRDMNLAPTAIIKGPYNHTSDIFVAFSKSHSNSVELAHALDKGIEELKRQGEYERFFQSIPTNTP